MKTPNGLKDLIGQHAEYHAGDLRGTVIRGVITRVAPVRLVWNYGPKCPNDAGFWLSPKIETEVFMRILGDSIHGDPKRWRKNISFELSKIKIVEKDKPLPALVPPVMVF